MITDIELSPELILLGKAFRLIEPDGSFNTDWFKRPHHYIARVLTDGDQRDATIELAEEILGTVRDQIELPELPQGESWIPLVDQTNNKITTGLYAVIEPNESSAKLSFGARVLLHEEGSLDLALFLKVPLLLISENNIAELLVGEAGEFVQLAASVEILSSPNGITTTNSELSLKGACFTAKLPMRTDEHASVQLIIKGLKLPNQEQAADIALADLAEDVGSHVVEVLLSLLQVQGEPLSNELNALLAMFGLGSGDSIPLIPLPELADQGISALSEWLQDIVSDSNTLEQWFTELSKLLGINTVSGDGTFTNPYVINLANTDWSPQITLYVESAAVGGSPILHVGARFEHETQDLPSGSRIPAKAVGKAIAEIEFMTLLVGSTPVIKGCGHLRMQIVLDSIDPSDPFIATTVSGQNITLRKLRAGLAIDTNRKPIPVIEAHDVTLGSNSYTKLDLLSTDVLEEVGSSVLSDIANELLNMLNVTSSTEGNALAALAGLVRPAGISSGDTWPDLVTLPEFFQNPTGAIACYHLRVLNQADAWKALAQEMTVLLKSADIAAPVITGEGTRIDPWQCILFDNRTSTDNVKGITQLQIFSDTTPEGIASSGDTSLYFSQLIQPLLPDVNGKQFTVSHINEFLRADLPLVSVCPKNPELKWMPGQRVRTTLAENLDITSDTISLQARSIELELVWLDSTGLKAEVFIREPKVTVSGSPIDLPDLNLDWLDGVALPDLPWPAIQALLGNWLASGNLGEIGDWGFRLAALFGWHPNLDSVKLKLPDLPNLELNLSGIDFPSLSLPDLFDNPKVALLDWFRNLFSGGGGGVDWPDLSLAVFSWLSSLFSGDGSFDPSLDIPQLNASLTGQGTYADPWAINLAPSSAQAAPELLLWLDPDGPSLAGITELGTQLLPAELRDLISGSSTDVPEISQLAEWLKQVSVLIPELRERLAHLGDLPTVLDALRTRILDGDGIVLVNDQKVAGWTEVELAPAAHLSAPGQFIAADHLPNDIPAPKQQIYLVAPLPGVSNWPGQQGATNIIDLRDEGVIPAAFDLSSIASTTNNNPWFILMPSRAAATVFPDPALDASTDADSVSPVPLLEGIEGQVQRLRRVVDEIVQASSGSVALIAHSITGQVARRVAKQGDISHLITLGTPHLGSTFEFLNDPDITNALRALQSLRGMLDDATADAPDIAAIKELIETFDVFLDEYVPESLDDEGLNSYSPVPLGDFTASEFDPLPASVKATTIITSIAPSDLDKALAAFVHHVIEKALSFLPGQGSGHTITHLGFGLRATVATGTVASGQVHAESKLRLDLNRVELQAGEERIVPRLQLRTELSRQDGWLVGTPDNTHAEGIPRDPRIRYAVIEVEAALDPTDVSANITLYDASAFGLHKDVWKIGTDSEIPDFDVLDTPLSPEVNVLLGSLANSLGDISGSSVSNRFARLLNAMQLGSINSDNQFQFVVDGVRRFLIDPETELRSLFAQGEATRDAMILELRSLVGLPTISDTQMPDSLEVALDNHFNLQIDFNNPFTIGLTINESQPLTIEDIVEISGSVNLSLNGHLQSDVKIHTSQSAGPIGKPGFLIKTNSQPTAGTDPVVVSFECLDGIPEILPDHVELHPNLDVEALTQWLKYGLPGEVLRLAFTELREQIPTQLQPLLSVIGLARDNAEHSLHNFAGLLAEPREWLSHSTILGSEESLNSLQTLAAGRITNLIDALRGLFELDGPSGTLPLPFDVTLSTTAVNDAVQFRLERPEKINGNIQHASSAIILINPGLSVQAGITSTISLINIPSLDYARVELTLAPGSLTAPQLDIRLKATDAAEIHFGILPEVTGLGNISDLADSAVDYVLPKVLDAVVAELNAHPIGTIFESLGDALDLRAPDDTFSTEKLKQLAQDPANYLRTQLLSATTNLFSALNQLADQFLPTGKVDLSDSSNRISITPITGINIRLEKAGVITRLCITTIDFEPISSLAISGEICLTQDGLEGASFEAEITNSNFLGVDVVPILPFIRVLFGSKAPISGACAETGLWLQELPVLEAERKALLIKLDFNTVSLSGICRTGDNDQPFINCTDQIAKVYLMPLVTELLIAQDELKSWLQKKVLGSGSPTSPTIGKILCQAGVLSGGANCSSPYKLARDGLLQDLIDGDIEAGMDRLTNRLWYLATEFTKELAKNNSGFTIDKFNIQFASAINNSRDVYGIRLSLTEPLKLISSGQTEFSLDTSGDKWQGSTGDPGITLLLVSVNGTVSSPSDIAGLDIALEPWIKIRGFGFNIAKKNNGKLIDAGVSVNGIRVDAAFERNFADAGNNSVSLAGGRCTLLSLSVPIGNATGNGNPVAAKLLSQGTENQQNGDTEDSSPVFNPQITFMAKPEFSIQFRLLGDIEKPIWIPIQQSFGPMYIEQIGLDYTDIAVPGGGTKTDTISGLLDGGVQLAGLNIGVDDLKLTVPFEEPGNTNRWEIDLAGLAISYQGSGVTLAGGFRKVTNAQNAVEYSGVLQVDIAGFGGLTAVGSYGVFPIAGTNEKYTSMFGFASLLAPIGGPPPFFVTGIGAGMGLNRSLITPDIDRIPTFPLVAALDSQSSMARNPMQALQTFGEFFPPDRGKFWFAAGIRFTSFALVESIAIVSVETGDGVDVQLLGLSRMDLPTADIAIARIELALRARFSSREKLLSIQAQLTDNSWLISKDCRLTGGFAFVIWFDKGEFVLTLGGYHPSFNAPDYFPQVPRLGFNWTPGGGITIKGESYFALTASCVMAGGRLEVSYRASIVWASLVAGINILVSWDPFYYNFEVYINISAGVRIRICVWLLGCATISLSFSIGVRLAIEGPELRGTAELDLDVTTVTVRFGARGSTTTLDPIPWTQFHEKYLAQGDLTEPTVSISILSGGLVPDAGTNEEPGTGEADNPFKVLPEFSFDAHTRTATKTIKLDSHSQVSSNIDIAPMKIAGVVSTYTVTVKDSDNKTITSLDVSFTQGQVPEGIWRYQSSDDLAPRAETIPALTNLQAVAGIELIGDGVKAIIIKDGEFLVEEGEPRPLPFHQEVFVRKGFNTTLQKATAYNNSQPKDVSGILEAYQKQLLNLGSSAKAELLSERAAPPVLGSLAEGMVDKVHKPIKIKAVPPPPKVEKPSDKVGVPNIVSILRGTPVTKSEKSYQRTTLPVSRRALNKKKLKAITPPLLSDVVNRWKDHVSTKLDLVAAPARKKKNTVTTTGSIPITGIVNGIRELNNSFIAIPSHRQRIKQFEKRIYRNLAINSGDTQIWILPNSRHEQQTKRPSFTLVGQQIVHFIFLDRAGDVLQQQLGQNKDIITVPQSTERIAFTGRGQSGEAGVTEGYAGWHQDMTLRQIHESTYLASDAVLRTHGLGTKRNGIHINQGIVQAQKALQQVRSARTLLPSDTTVAVIGLDITGNISTVNIAELVTLSLSGASRLKDKDGEVKTPTVIDHDGRLFAVFEIIANNAKDNKLSHAIEISVVTEPDIRLSAVIGSNTTEQNVIKRLITTEIEALFKPNDVIDPVVSQLRWSDPENPQGIINPRRSNRLRRKQS